MILTKQKIKENISNNNIVISPFKEEYLNPNSIDVTLNEELLVYDSVILNTKLKNETSSIIIPNEGFLLRPGQLYLGKTNEYTETLNLIPILEGKSSLARLGISIHSTAGFGDVGFKGNWTLEISCIQPVKIYKDMRIGQLYYQEVSGDVSEEYTGKYQESTEIGASKSYLDFI